MTPLIDATEMYLRTVWELEEEGIPALRARLVERLGVSAPAVSETVNRLTDEGLLELDEQRRVLLTDSGRELAASVMRKHRLAERLLTDVIGLDLAHAHNEACRWEHVISDRVEARLVQLLGAPETSPYGNPIPSGNATEHWSDLTTALQAAELGGQHVVERISERLQTDEEEMLRLDDAGVRPGAVMRLERSGDAVSAALASTTLRLDVETASMVWVRAAG